MELIHDATLPALGAFKETIALEETNILVRAIADQTKTASALSVKRGPSWK